MTQVPAYLIQGFYFQDKYYLGVQAVPIDGNVAVMKRGIFHDMFAGLIWQENSSSWIGLMNDSEGQSRLEEVHLTPTELDFCKQYDGRQDSILYQFRLEGTLWVGSYTGTKVGQGDANCVLTPAPNQMLDSIQG